MLKLSTGADSTLRNWLNMSIGVFGPDSEATKFLKKKADEQGLDEEVLADEGQLLMVLFDLHQKGEV